MPTATRTFRVFVSSTFEDLRAERDALQRDVFPRLRKLCEENNARFQAIDLRWGVRDEAALDQQTMEICLREIARCQQTGIKPNFIVLLGERYGWRPLPARIEAGEFERVFGRVADANKRLVDDWYERDDNAVPPEYLLMPRTGEFADKDRWGEMEQKLHRILQEAARNAGLAPESLIKYEASATHQEILKGLGKSEEDRRHVFAFFREPAEGATVDAELEALEEDLRRKLPAGNVRPFRMGEIGKLCTDVEESLKKVILDETSKFTSRDALDLEIEAHDRFAEDRCRIFVGRRDALTTISDYLSRREWRPLVLHGESGSGKSAVMAKASELYRGPGRVIRRFIGASPESTSGHSLLTSLCKQIAPGETPVDYYQLEKAFQERLAGVTAERPQVLFIDALDQLAASDPAREARWLPAELSPYVKIIVSTTDDEEQLSLGIQVPLERMSTAEGGQALDELLRVARRALRPWQRDLVLEHFKRCGLPLYLKLAAEQSLLWKSFSLPDACKLGEGIPGILDTLFDRLASNANHGPVLAERSLGYLAAARYGLTEGEMLDVLTADDVVWDDFDKKKHHNVSERRLPVVVWSRLSLDLEPYLTERAAPGGTVIAFYHRQLAERVVARFLAGEEAQARHNDLARHFLSSPAWLDEGHKAPNARRAAELVFQQREARQWKAVEATLLDSLFLFAKVAAGMVLDLDDDYRALPKGAPPAFLESHEAVGLIGEALGLSIHVVARDSMQFPSQVVGRLLPYKEKPLISGFINRVSAGASKPWLSPLYPALQPPGSRLIRILDGHTLNVNGVAACAEWRRAISGSMDRTLKVWDLESGRVLNTLEGHSQPVNAVAMYAEGHRAISGSMDQTLKVWDLDSGRIAQTLKGHSSGVTCVAVYSEGRRAISGSMDQTLKVWDLESGRSLQTLECYFASGWVKGVAVYAEGHRAISAYDDRTLKVWDLESGRLVQTLEGHSHLVNDVVVYAAGRRAISASSDKTLKVWDLKSGRVVQTMEGHTSAVTCVVVCAEDRRAISTSDDHTLKVWDLESGQVLQSLVGHSARVNGVAVYAEGRRAISASDDRTLRMWDLESSEREAKPLEGHSQRVSGVAVYAEGRRAISASGDQTLKVWDLESGRAIQTLQGHTAAVSGVAVYAEGRRAISASFDQTLRVWDLESGCSLQTLRGHSNCVTGVAVFADGSWAISTSWDQTLKVWDLKSGRVVWTLKGHSNWVNSVALDVDGLRAVSTSNDDTLKVWNLVTGGLERTLEGHKRRVNGIAVYEDGHRAVTASWDSTLKVWDLEIGYVLRTLEGHTSGVMGVAVCAEGRRAISASDDKMLKVWNLDIGEEIATFTCDVGAQCCAFIDTRRILVGDALGRLHWLEILEQSKHSAPINPITPASHKGPLLWRLLAIVRGMHWE